MARIRTIKPEFWLNEELAALPATTRLLAIGLLNHSDDEGYFVANHRVIKAAIFPFDDSLSIQGMLMELSRLDYIRLANGSDGKPYGVVVNFKKHQVVNRPTASKIKPLASFSEFSVTTHGVITDDSLPERKGKERNREEERNAAASATVSSRKPLQTLKGYAEKQKAAGQKAIPDDHAVHTYAEQAGIPFEFLALAWHEFKSRYTSSDDQKKYRDWPGVFLKAVKGNWLKVWYLEGDTYKLTTVGLQAQRAQKAAA